MEPPIWDDDVCVVESNSCLDPRPTGCRAGPGVEYRVLEESGPKLWLETFFGVFRPETSFRKTPRALTSKSYV
jgi:hypothetical protein